MRNRMVGHLPRKGFARRIENTVSLTVARRKAEQLAAEIRQDLEACNAYAKHHGSFAEMVRDHYRRRDDDDR